MHELHACCQPSAEVCSHKVGRCCTKGSLRRTVCDAIEQLLHVLWEPTPASFFGKVADTGCSSANSRCKGSARLRLHVGNLANAWLRNMQEDNAEETHVEPPMSFLTTLFASGRAWRRPCSPGLRARAV